MLHSWTLCYDGLRVCRLGVSEKDTINDFIIVLIHLCQSFSHRLPHISIDDWIDTRVRRCQQERWLTQITLNIFVGAVCGIQELKLVGCPGNDEYSHDQSTHPGNLAQQRIIRVRPWSSAYLEWVSGYQSIIDLHGITVRGNGGITEVKTAEMGYGFSLPPRYSGCNETSCLEISIDYRGKTAVTAVIGTISIVLPR